MEAFLTSNEEQNIFILVVHMVCLVTIDVNAMSL